MVLACRLASRMVVDSRRAHDACLGAATGPATQTAAPRPPWLPWRAQIQDLAYWLETAKMRSNLTRNLLGGVLLQDVATNLQAAASAAPNRTQVRRCVTLGLMGRPLPNACGLMQSAASAAPSRTQVHAAAAATAGTRAGAAAASRRSR